MKRQAIYSSLAENDLVDLIAYIGYHNRTAAHRFRQQVREISNTLALHPDMGTPCGYTQPGTEKVRVRTIPGFANYLIFFQRIEHGVRIERIRHGSLDWQAGIELQ